MNYGTTFWLTENPMSEGGKWANGLTNGIDWCDMRTGGAMCFGTQTGTQSSGVFNDSTAVLNGSFGADQFAQATVNVLSGATGGWFAEVELRLRTTISAHVNSGYEINYSVSADGGSPYLQIVRWNGPVNNFTQLTAITPAHLAQTGDILRATVVGSTFTVFLNGTQVATATDNTFTGGNPGIGHWLSNTSGSGDPTRYGFSAWSGGDFSNVIVAHTRYLGI